MVGVCGHISRHSSSRLYSKHLGGVVGPREAKERNPISKQDLVGDPGTLTPRKSGASLGYMGPSLIQEIPVSESVRGVWGRLPHHRVSGFVHLGEGPIHQANRLAFLFEIT